jgi:ABC-2 type transport system permease protein
VGLVIRRELGHYFRTWSGYVFVAVLLVITGLLYNAYAVGSTAKYSADVLSGFFYLASGTTMAAGLFLSMRVIAEEHQTGTLPLLTSSPLTDGQLVWAKFVSAYLMVVLYVLCTSFMPALVFVNGSVSLGHIFAGYVGLLCIGAASTAIGVFGSAFARTQLFAIVLSAVILTALLVLWLLAKQVEGPLGDVVAYLALHDKHFRPFMDGTIATSHIIYYLSVTAFFLVLARNVLEGRRWRS